MYVSFEKLVDMLGDAFVAGLEGMQDLHDQTIDEILAHHEVADPRELRIYGITELQKFPVGSKFCHSLLGYGEITTKKGVRNPFMKFESNVMHAFASDAFPWNLPMCFLSE